MRRYEGTLQVQLNQEALVNDCSYCGAMSGRPCVAGTPPRAFSAYNPEDAPRTYHSKRLRRGREK